jgi:adenylate cyclase
MLGSMFGRISVGARLLLAFFGISAFSIIAAAAAMYSLLAVGDVVDHITERQVPSAIDALKMSRQAERIVAAAPALLTVSSATQQDDLSRRIDAEMAQLESLLARLMGESDGERAETRIAALGELSALAQQMRVNLQELDEMVAERLAVAQRKREVLGRLLDTHTQTGKLLAPWLLITAAEIEELRKTSGDGGIAPQLREAAAADLKTVQAVQRALQTVELETSVTNDILLRAAAAEDTQQLNVLRFRVGRSLTAVKPLIPNLDAKLQPLLTARLEEFDGYSAGPEAIPETRTRELELLEEAQRLLARNYELTREVTDAVDTLVGSAENDIAVAKQQARLVQEVSSGVLIGIVALSVLSSILIVWLYVRRNIVRRLTGLSNSMMAIAGGDLEAPIPSGGQDEIGGMAEALEKFRDTAIEVRETNLREIQDARRRLVDAIESISEGFSLYDADDHLVIANERYRRLLYPEIEDTIVPGATFESILRNAAKQGLIPEAQEGDDAWVAERLAQHRNPSGPHIQKRSNGRFIQINERKTEDGGTVAVYMDITELKEHETEIIRAKDAAEGALADLQRAQQRLIQAEKMASLGQLTAGIAHEIKNPLNFVNNFAGLSEELLSELKQTLGPAISELESEARSDVDDLISTLTGNLSRIAEHGRRADGIVKSMLLHSRGGSVESQNVNLNALIEEALNLSYHGARAQDQNFNVTLERDLDPNLALIEVVPQDITRVFLNLFGNGFYATTMRQRNCGAGSDYRPTLRVTTRDLGEKVEIRVRDNGVGMLPEVQSKLFTPFFTTKPTGEGTGLGLSISYDIVVQQHGGTIAVDSSPGRFTEFVIQLPRAAARSAKPEIPVGATP